MQIWHQGDIAIRAASANQGGRRILVANAAGADLRGRRSGDREAVHELLLLASLSVVVTCWRDEDSTGTLKDKRIGSASSPSTTYPLKTAAERAVAKTCLSSAALAIGTKLHTRSQARVASAHMLGARWPSAVALTKPQAGSSSDPAQLANQRTPTCGAMQFPPSDIHAVGAVLTKYNERSRIGKRHGGLVAVSNKLLEIGTLTDVEDVGPLARWESRRPLWHATLQGGVKLACFDIVSDPDNDAEDVFAQRVGHAYLALNAR